MEAFLHQITHRKAILGVINALLEDVIPTPQLQDTNYLKTLIGMKIVCGMCSDEHFLHKNMLGQFWNLLYRETDIEFTRVLYRDTDSEFRTLNTTVRFTLGCGTCVNCTHISREIHHNGWIHAKDFDMRYVDDIDILFCEQEDSGCCHSAPMISQMDFGLIQRLEDEPSMKYDPERHKQRVRETYGYCSNLYCSNYAYKDKLCDTHWKETQ